MLLITFTWLHKYLIIRKNVLSSNVHTHNGFGVFLSVVYWLLAPNISESENTRAMEKMKGRSCVKSLALCVALSPENNLYMHTD